MTAAAYSGSGFNYAYRRTVTPSAAEPTPGSTTSPLPATGAGSGGAATPTVGTRPSGTPVPSVEKSVPPHLNPGHKSTASTPPPPIAPSSGRETPKDTKTNGGPSPADKAERERAKKERKKERKQQERAEREAADTSAKEGDSKPPTPLPENASSPTPGQAKSGKGTPDLAGDAKNDGGLTSPATESTGARTPTSRRPPRNPWTIFMRMAGPATEQEVRDFYGEAKAGVSAGTTALCALRLTSTNVDYQD